MLFCAVVPDGGGTANAKINVYPADILQLP